MMHDWTTDFKAREDALWHFCERMRKNPSERERCKKDRWYAKTCFAEGQFYLEGDPAAGSSGFIPSGVEFRVYEADPPENRDDMVIIVLPKDNVTLPLPNHQVRGLEDVWRCTWPSYLTLKHRMKPRHRRSK